MRREVGRSAEATGSLHRAVSGRCGRRPNPRLLIPPRERRASLEAFRCYREILARESGKSAPPGGGGRGTQLLEFKERLDDALGCRV